MEGSRTPLSAALLSAAYSAPQWRRSSLFPQCSACSTECAPPEAARRAPKRRIPMAEIKNERSGVSGWVVFLGLVAAIALGLSIYSGIRGRVEAASNLQQATE